MSHIASSCLVSKRVLAESSSDDEAVSTTHYHREAAAALKGHPNGDILAWLKLARSAHSIEPVPEQRPGSAHLSSYQIHALFVLKDCPDDQLAALLELARRARNEPTSTALARGSSDDSGLSREPPSFIGQSDLSLFEAKSWMGPSEPSPSSPVFSPHGRRRFAADDVDLFGGHAVRSVNSTLSRNCKNHYWCTVCECPNSYRNSGNWKKHEKEHETMFVCKLDSAANDSMADQTPRKKAFSCKRRDIMVNHLNKSHGILGAEAGRDLADQGRITVKKQAWSCGFCGSLFLNFRDRLRHIDIEHFRKYEDIRQWNLNKVMHGLLLQPKMENAWKKRTASLSPWVQLKDLVWPEVFAKDMRTKLEIGPLNESDADRLACEVFSACKPKESLEESAMVSSTVFHTGIAGASSLLPPNQDQVLTDQTFGSTPAYSQRSSNMHATTNLYDNSIFGQSPEHAYNSDSKTVPLMAASQEDSRGTYNAPPFYPSRDWGADPERDLGCSGFDDAVNGANRGIFRFPSD